MANESTSAGRPIPDRARMDEIFESVKNWGRWGPDDEAGALNLITEEVRRSAAASVRHGRIVSCSRPLPVDPAPDNPHPALHMMIAGGDDCLLPGFDLESTSDFVGIAFHGMASSHLDALCHVHKDGLMYNGVSGKLVKSTGAKRNSVMAARDGIVSRGVLVDLPRHFGVPWLELGRIIDPDELDTCLASQDVTLQSGDILLVATGRDARRAEHGPWNPMAEGLAGLHPECIPWLHEKGVSVLGSDVISDVVPLPPIEGWAMPIHECTLVAMGVHLLDNLDLSRLQAACDELSQWTFQLTIGVLPIEEGTGSPVNPIALL